MVCRTVFIDTSITDSANLASRFRTSEFDIVNINDHALGYQQIQNYLTTNNLTADSINVISASRSLNGVFTPRLVFIDPSVADYQQLIADMPSDDTIVVLDANQDGVQQINDFLERNTSPDLKLQAIDIVTNINSLDIVSHGALGKIIMGDLVLSRDTLNAVVDASAPDVTYADLLANIGSHLTENSNIFLYGCDVAIHSTEQHFIQDLEAVIGADIAASNNLTGITTTAKRRAKLSRALGLCCINPGLSKFPLLQSAGRI